MDFFDGEFPTVLICRNDTLPLTFCHVAYKRVAAMTRSRAEELRRKAQECFDLARTISLKTDRAILIDMAQTYLRLAKEQETQEEIIPPRVTEQPQPAAQQQQQVQPKDDDKKE
jgi:hypothetical protein